MSNNLLYDFFLNRDSSLLLQVPVSLLPLWIVQLANSTYRLCLKRAFGSKLGHLLSVLVPGLLAVRKHLTAALELVWRHFSCSSYSSDLIITTSKPAVSPHL